jgi:hypothetical protein
MIDPEFWRLLATISATMIGLVFLGTIYYLESGWEEYDVYRQEMESMSVRGAQLIIAYFSTVLVLSLLREPFLPEVVTTVAFVVLAAAVILVTRSANEALRTYEEATPSEWDSLLLKSSRIAGWVAFILVFVAPPATWHATRSVDSPPEILTLPELSVAWIAILALLFGYWNLVQFLLLPYEIREQERELERERQRPE